MTPPPPLKGSQLVLGTLSLSFVNFMVILDMTIANVAVPHIAGNLAASPSQGTWVITSYAVAEAITVPLTGWLAQRFTTVRLVVACILLFTLASFFCGISTSLGMLVGARVLQGLAGGPIMALTQTLLLASFPRAKAGAAMGMFAMTTLLAPVFGPIVGGFIVDNWSWHWIFFINLPVGLLGASLVWSVYGSRNTEAVSRPVDYVGLIFLILFVGCFQIILDKGAELDWFGSGIIVALAVVSLLAFVLFVGWELTDEHPVVDLHLFKRRNVVAGVAGLSAFFGVVFGALVLIPLWLQTQMGYTAISAGLAIAPMGVAAAFIAPFVGRFSTRIDPRVMVTLGVAIVMISFVMRSRFTTEVDFFSVAMSQAVQGLGMPMIFMPCVLLATTGIEPQRVASVAGLQNFIRTTAGAFGAALTNTYWSNQITQHRADLVPHLAQGVAQYDAWNSTVGAQGFNSDQALALIDRTLQSQAVMLATDQYFTFASILLLGVVAIIWTAKPVAFDAHIEPGMGGH